jgi:hypothetical protein
MTPAPSRTSTGQRRRAHPGDLHKATGHPAVPERAEMAGEALRVLLRPVADQVVVEAHGTGHGSGGDRGRGDGRAAGAERGPDRGTGGQRRAAGERHGPAPEVDPLQLSGVWIAADPSERRAGGERPDVERPDDWSGHGLRV